MQLNMSSLMRFWLISVRTLTCMSVSLLEFICPLIISFFFFTNHYFIYINYLLIWFLFFLVHISFVFPSFYKGGACGNAHCSLWCLQSLGTECCYTCPSEWLALEGGRPWPTTLLGYSFGSVDFTSSDIAIKFILYPFPICLFLVILYHDFVVVCLTVEADQSKGFVTFSLTNGPEYHVSQVS